MDELVPPVVTTKPARGREMQTTTIPTDMFDTMRMMSAKKTLGGEDISPELQKPTDGTAEYYHEGYVDGKLYLVPDSNLEAMRDIINFKMRPRRSTRYKHQTSYELSDYDHFRGKLDGLFAKLDNIQDLNSNLSDEDRKKTGVVWGPEERLQKKSEEESEDKYEDQVSEYKSEDEDSEDKSEAGDSEDKYEDGGKPKPKSDVKFKEPDVHYLRFLVSGHFKKDQKPIYIVQDYNGEPDLFKNQKADFFSKQKDGDVDVFISGKFYNENMLEESDGKPVALMTKPVKIQIDMKKSKIYYDQFKDIYNMKNFDISFKGEFIKSKRTNRITPFLTLGVEKRPPSQKVLKSPNYERKHQNIYNKNMSPTTVLVYKPKNYTNPFSHDVDHISNGGIKKNPAKEYEHSKNMYRPFSEINPSLIDNSSRQVATHFFSLSEENFLGEGIKSEPINKPFDHPYQPLSKQSDNILNIKVSADAVPFLSENLNTQNTTNTKKSLREGLRKTFLKGSSLLKTLFERKPSADNFEVHKNTQKPNDNSKNIKVTQKTPTTDEKLLKNKKEHALQNKIRSIFHLFK